MAYSDDTIELVEKKGFLLLQGFDQKINTSYLFTNHESNSANANFSSQKGQEAYDLTTYAAIINPHLFRFSLNVEMAFQQIINESKTAGSTFSSSTRYQYGFSGSALDRSNYPISVHSSRALDTILPPFAPAINADSTTNGMELALMHDILPIKFKYERTTLDLSSGSSKSTSTSNSFSLSGTHKYREISYSGFALNVANLDSVSRGIDDKTNSFTANLNNSIFLGTKKNHTLNSTLQWSETKPGGVLQQNGSLSESLSSHFGKALDAQLAYLNSFNQTINISGKEQSQYLTSIMGSLQHRLFQSLSTRLRGSFSNNSNLGGDETRYSGLIGATYRKKLSADSMMDFDISGDHTVTDRNVSLRDRTIRDEEHIAGQPGDIIALNTLNTSGKVLPGSVSILIKIPIPNTNPIQYLPPALFTDYTVDYNLGRITQLAATVPNSVFLITYVVRNDTSIKYSTDTLNLSGSVSFQDGKYTFSGTLVTVDQSLLSGQIQNSLRNSRIAQIRFLGNMQNQRYSLMFEDFSSGDSKYRFLEGSWEYRQQSSLGSLSLQMRNRYAIYDAVGSAAARYQNTATATGSFTRALTYNSQFTLLANVSDDRSGRGQTDLINVNANVSAQFNKLSVRLNGQTGWRFFGTLLTRDDIVRLEMSRYF
jgi:hypothetical protein